MVWKHIPLEQALSDPDSSLCLFIFCFVYLYPSESHVELCRLLCGLCRGGLCSGMKRTFFTLVGSLVCSPVMWRLGS